VNFINYLEKRISKLFQPGEKGIQWLGLEILRLEANENWTGALANEEAVLVILGGHCSVSIQAKEHKEWKNIGIRVIFLVAPQWFMRRAKANYKSKQKVSRN